jgi:hypothetical protein
MNIRTTTWSTDQASDLAAYLYNNAILDTVFTAIHQRMTIQSHMDLSGWHLSRVFTDHGTVYRAEVKVTYNQGQYARQTAGTVDAGRRYIILDHIGQPTTSADTLHEALVRALQELVQITPVEWPARWPYGEFSSVNR